MIVNGVVVIDHGQHTGARPGMPVYGKAYKAGLSGSAAALPCLCPGPAGLMSLRQLSDHLAAARDQEAFGQAQHAAVSLAPRHIAHHYRAS